MQVELGSGNVIGPYCVLQGPVVLGDEPPHLVGHPGPAGLPPPVAVERMESGEVGLPSPSPPGAA